MQDQMIYDLLLQIEKKIALALELPKESDPYGSRDQDQLFAALSKAQGEYKPVHFNRENPYFKNSYADLDAILVAVRPALTKNNLSFIQQIRVSEEGQTILHTKIAHSSGQWLESRSRIIPVKNDPQTFGSTLTYQKRYAAMAILGVTVAGDRSDDDAEVAMVEARQIVAKGPSNKYNPREQKGETITKEQLEELEYELSTYEDLAEEILDKMQLQSLADMPKNKYQAAVTRIREIKMMRSGLKEPGKFKDL
jgi:hypothetical protein